MKRSGWLATGSMVALSLLTFLSGCGGGGMSLVAVTPSAATLDAGQSLAISASVVNDSAHKGASFSLAGVGTLGNSAIVPSNAGSATFLAVSYAAPASVAASQTAVVTAASVNMPSQKATVTITINAAPSIATAALPGGMVGTAYSASVAAAGGTGVLNWSVASGALPAGLLLNPNTGLISGTPTAFGAFSFTIAVTDHAPLGAVTATQAYTVTVVPALPSITTSNLPNGIAGTFYSQQLAYTGGNGIPVWTVISGGLPAGLSLNAAGLISGTPALTAAGNTYPFTVQVALGSQTSSPVTLQIAIYALPLVTTMGLASGNIGFSYSQQLTYTGGNGATPAWSIVAGSLPSGSGLTLGVGGLISGTPTTQAAYSFSVTVTVGTQTSAPQALTLQVFSLIVTSGASATGEVALPFGFTLTARGGTGPYTWSLAGGSASLPAGLFLNAATGAITGTPTTPGSTNVTIQAKDSLGATAVQAMTFTIAAARTTVNNAALKGQYAVLLSGFDSSGSPLSVVGSFTADGNGNITSGTLDSNGTGQSAEASLPLAPGGFSVGADNRGKLTFVTSSGTRTFVFALNTVVGGVANAGNITEFDASGQSLTGVLALQAPAAFTTPSITGGYAFGAAGYAVNSTATALTHRSMVGEVQFNGLGGITSAEYLASGSVTTAPITPASGVFAVGANGRSTLSLVKPGGAGTVNWVVYVVSAARLFLLSADPAGGSIGTNDLLSGTMLQQTVANGNFSLSSLNGPSVVRNEGIAMTSGGVAYPDVQAGLYNFNGAGKVSLSGDENAGGKSTANALTGSYTVAPNGRVLTTLSAGLGGCADCLGTGQSYAYLVGAGQGFVMDFTPAAMSGSFEPQTATGISAATLAGSYSFGSLAPLVQGSSDAEGVFAFSGAGSASATQDITSSTNLAPDSALSFTYVVPSNGRAVLTSSLGASSVCYIVSATKSIVLDLKTAVPLISELLH